MQRLTRLFIQSTRVKKLSPLFGLRRLEMVAYKKSLVTKTELQAFKRRRPKVRIW